MRSIHVLIVVVGISLAAPAWANGTIPSARTETTVDRHGLEKRAERTLEDLRQAYLGKNPNGFMKNVSEEAYFSVTDLKMRLGSYFSGFGQIELSFVVDSILTEGDKVLIKTHWQKRAVRRSTGQVETSAGTTELTFGAEGSAMRLLDQQNDIAF